MQTLPTTPANFEFFYQDGTLQATWDASSVPTGYSVNLQFLDEAGAPLNPQPTVTYSAGLALVSNSSIVVGGSFRLRVQVLSPWSATETVVAQNVPALTEVNLEWHESALHARWTAPAAGGPYTYEGRLLDSEGRPVAVQPSLQMEGITGFKIDGASLTDHDTYAVGVRANWSGSRGPWVKSAAYTIDKSIPDSAVLRALLQELRDAIAKGNRSFALSPGILKAPAISNLFGSLLRAANNTIQLNGASVSSTPSSVTLTATAAYFSFDPLAISNFVFTASNEQLHLELSASSLGSHTVPQLIDDGIIPPSPYSPSDWATSLDIFPKLSMLLDSAEGKIRFGGDQTAASWSIPIGLARVSIGEVSPYFEIVAPTESQPIGYRPMVRTTLAIGDAGIPILLTLPCGSHGWDIQLAVDNGFAVGNLARLNPLMGGANSELPAGVVAIGGFKLTYLGMDFAPKNPNVWHISTVFSVGPEENSEWRAVNGVIKLKRLGAALDLTLYQAGSLNVAASGSVTGLLEIADTIQVDAGIYLPPGPDGLLLTGGVIADNFNLSSLAPYLGGNAAPLTDFLARLGTVGSLGLRSASILFKPDGPSPSLEHLAFSFEISNWNIPSLAWFRVQNVALEMEIDHPLDGTRRLVTGQVAAQLILGGFALDALFDFTDPSRWRMQLQATASVLPDLSALNDVVSSAAIASFVPSGLSCNATYGLGRFTLVYNSAQSYLESGSLLLESSYEWTWFAGLRLTNIALDLQFSRPSAGAALALNGSISGTVVLDGTELTVSAAKPAGSENWTFAGELASNLTIDFGAILGAFVSGFRLPSGYDFPSAIPLVFASVEVTPATGKLDFYANSTQNWSVAIGQTTLALTSLGGEVHLPGGNGNKTASVSGTFTLNSVKGFAEIALATGTTSLVVHCEISTGTSPSASQVTDGVIGPGTFTSVLAPPNFVRPDAFASAALTVNVAQSAVLLTGKYVAAAAGPASRYASLALLIEPKQPQGPMGFMLSASLENWTLADVSPSLAGLDTAIGLVLNKAAVVISTIEGSLDPLEGTSDPMVSQFVGALPAGMSAGMCVKPGLNFYIQLDFTGGLLNNIRSIVNLQGNYILAAQIPADPSAAQTFSASLGRLTLLSILEFKNVQLMYTRVLGPPSSSQLKLTGEIVARLDKDYEFIGDLQITDKASDFKVATTKSVISPLGIPNLTLDALGFRVHVDYIDSQPSTSVMAFWGSIAFGVDTVLKAEIAMENRSPVVVLVELTQPDGQPTRLSISALFNTVTGLSWPEILDLSLSNGQLSWVPGTQSVTWQHSTYAPGFRARVRATIFFLPEITLDVSIFSGNTPGVSKGLTATAQFSDPIDWGFIKFTGTREHGGPSVGPYASLDSRIAQRPFCLGTAIALFSTNVGEVEIAVGKDSMSGVVTLPSDAGIFAGSQFNFTWAKDKFTVEDWPLPDLDLPSFDLTNLAGEGVCSQIILDLLPIDSKFNLHAGLAVSPPGAGKAATLDIKLSGTFDLQVTSSAYANDPLVTANIASATVHLPLPAGGTYDWNALANSFVEAIKGAAQSIIDNLLLDPVNLAKLSAVAGAKWAVANAVDYLVCRGMSRAAAEAAVTAATSASVGEVAAAACAGGTAIAVGGVIATIAPGGQVTNQGDKARPSEPKPAKPSTPTLSFDTDALAIDWGGSSAANVTLFGIGLNGNKSGVVAVSAIPGTITHVPISLLQMNQTYSATVIASGPGGQSPPSEPGSLFLVSAPVIDRLSFQDPEFTAHWGPIENSSNYEIVVLDGAGSRISGITVVFAGTSAIAVGPPFERGGEFKVQVRATAPRCKGPWSTASVLTILSAPAITARIEGTNLVVSWPAVPNAESYAVRIVDSARRPLLPEPEIARWMRNPNPDTPLFLFGANIAGPALVNGIQLIVEVTAGATDANGMVGSQSITFRPLSAPSNLNLCFDAALHQIDATWQGDAGSYTIEVRDAQGVPLKTQPEITRSGSTASFSTNTLQSGVAYQVAVRQTTPNANSDWAVESIHLRGLEPPLDLTVGKQVKLGYALVQATWRWASSDPELFPVGFELRVLRNDSVVTPIHIEYSGASATIDGGDFVDGDPYQIEVRVVRLADATYKSCYKGLWSTPVSFVPFPLTASAGLTVRKVAQDFVATWDTTARASRYAVEVLDAQSRALTPQPSAFISGTFAIIDASGLAAETEYNVQVQAIFGSPTAPKPGPFSSPFRVSMDSGWREVQPNGPAQQFEAVVLSFAGRVWSIAGVGSNAVYSSLDGVTWKQHANAPFSSRTGAAGVVFAGKMWIVGGIRGVVLNDVWASSDGDHWEQITPAAQWPGRNGLSAVAFQDKMWILGGHDTDRGKWFNDVWSSSDGVAWTQVRAEAAWGPREFAGVAVLGGQIFVMGGYRGGKGSLQDVWASPDGTTWILKSSAPWESRSSAGIAVIRGTLYLAGGYCQGLSQMSHELADVWTTQDGIAWKQIDSKAPWGPRGYHGMAELQNTLILVGGFKNSVWRYRPEIPCSANLAPVLASSDRELIARLFAKQVASGRLSQGTFHPGSGAVSTASADQGRFLAAVTLGEDGVTCSNLLVCCASTPLTTFEWYGTSGQSVGIRSAWTGRHWSSFGSASILDPVPYRGLYFYLLVLNGVPLNSSLTATFAARSAGVTMSFYRPPRDLSRFPIPDGFAPAVASLAVDLIREVFDIEATSPTFRGQFNSPGSSVTTTALNDLFQVSMNLGSRPLMYNITATVYACADNELVQWDWFASGDESAGISSVWTGNGWQPFAFGQHPAGAVAVDGMYYYRVEINGAVVTEENVRVVITSSEPATLVFYTAT